MFFFNVNIFSFSLKQNKTSTVTFRVRLLQVRSCRCRLRYVNSLMFLRAWHVDFGMLLRKRKSQLKYEAFYCSEIQSQRFTADKLSCETFKALQGSTDFFKLLPWKCTLFSIYVGWIKIRTYSPKNCPSPSQPIGQHISHNYWKQMFLCEITVS